MFAEDLTQPLQCTAGMVKRDLQELRFESLPCSLQNVLKQIGKTLWNSLASFQWNQLSGPHTKSKVKKLLRNLSHTTWVLTDLQRRKGALYELPDTQPSLHNQLHHQTLNVFAPLK